MKKNSRWQPIRALFAGVHGCAIESAFHSKEDRDLIFRPLIAQRSLLISHIDLLPPSKAGR
jgi:hypothetical protein